MVGDSGDGLFSQGIRHRDEVGPEQSLRGIVGVLGRIVQWLGEWSKPILRQSRQIVVILNNIDHVQNVVVAAATTGFVRNPVDVIPLQVHLVQ